jgi:hypothetical protein
MKIGLSSVVQAGDGQAKPVTAAWAVLWHNVVLYNIYIYNMYM